MDTQTTNKALIAPLRAAMYDHEESRARTALSDVAAPDVLFRLCHPFGHSTGTDAFYDTAYRELFEASPDL